MVERASPRVAAVLAAAAQARSVDDDRRTRAAAASLGLQAFAGTELRSSAGRSAVQGRVLNAAAQRAYWQGGDVARAFALQWEAFGALPQDAEVAGNLAFYAIQSKPRQVAMARQLAIYALATATRAAGPSRLEDWGTLAVANALSGRTAEAEQAMLVLLTVSGDANRSCRSALSSVATFGPALKLPAQALLVRANERGATAAPDCQLPPNWSAGSRLP